MQVKPSSVVAKAGGFRVTGGFRFGRQVPAQPVSSHSSRNAGQNEGRHGFFPGGVFIAE